MILYKYHGGGNDFLIADNREGRAELSLERIKSICKRHTGFGADGVMFLEKSLDKDFSMRYYNSDGSGGMMCGNGGRCIVAFAADKGYTSFNFDAPDGPHSAEIIQGGNPKIVRLTLKDVNEVSLIGPDEYFIDTGTRHLVRFVDSIEDYDVLKEGRLLRHDHRFAPLGANVDFVEVDENRLLVRTYEKGVEGETLACGTGIVASAIAAYVKGVPGSKLENEAVEYEVEARISSMKVEFAPEKDPPVFKNIWLTGPAEFIGIINI